MITILSAFLGGMLGGFLYNCLLAPIIRRLWPEVHREAMATLAKEIADAVANRKSS